MLIPENKKVYFASDQHFGAPTRVKSLVREAHFLDWLTEIKDDAHCLFLLGDLFDFWFEYKKVVPKGFVRILGKLAEFTDASIPVYYFVGNHDLWMNDYFQEELGIPVYHSPQVFEFQNKRFFIGHGDGLGPGDKGYKRMKKVFTNPAAKWLYRWLHPDFGVRLAQHLSVKNKLISGKEDIRFLGKEKEWLVQYCQRKLADEHFDYFIFGHRHLPLDIELKENSRYINLGDWITHFSYASFDAHGNMQLQYFPLK
ncbi:MAG: UDP-2,3-diacylglucosamine diphosphatase [Flavobacteriaceae bacterium]|nr:UDP-2,3-diacylglucosamine diphosphatase [Flavobacteriaceae bacterium]